jgi:hypothetical protein
MSKLKSVKLQKGVYDKLTAFQKGGESKNDAIDRAIDAAQSLEVIE